MTKPPRGARMAGVLAAIVCAAACAGRGAGTAALPPGFGGAAGSDLLPEETRVLADLRQITFGGENAEAYWSLDGRQLSFQARGGSEGCDRIYRVSPWDARPAPIPVSSGRGATTCAHFLPSGDLVYSSTHLAGDACPPRPDMSQGYVWALHAGYDIFRSSPDGVRVTRLTEIAGYDAEATVCGRNGAIVFTSLRDGDLELYRMDPDGKNVRRLTHAEGYDGGAFWNADCSRIVWRASRPRTAEERASYRDLLARGLVKPSKLEIWVAGADGSEPMQITYLDAASFAPSFHPDGKTIVFASNAGAAPREFDLWAVRPDGTGLGRVTSAPGFDGFPHFSPDGKWLAFSSNRGGPPGGRDTNVFVARWLGAPAAAGGPAVAGAADRIAADIRWLADPAREGRGLGSRGIEDSAKWLARRLGEIGGEPAGDAPGSFLEKFPVVTAVDVLPETVVRIGEAAVAAGDFSVPGFSATGRVQGEVVLAGHGLVDASHGVDDYRGIEARGKVVLVRRFVPEDAPYDAATRRRLGDLRLKAWIARERGAAALLVADVPVRPAAAAADWKAPDEAPLVRPAPEAGADAGLPVVMLRRSVAEKLMAGLAARQPVRALLDVRLARRTSEAANVVGRIRAGAAGSKSGTVVLGAHYDHLGLGGKYSLAPDRHEPHLGADDNASGTAALLEVARGLHERRADLAHDVVVAFFSGEESGLLGSSHFTRARVLVASTIAMLNLDMVGRMRHGRVEVLGAHSASEWQAILDGACAAEKVACATSGDGYGPSDQASFYAAGVPVLHFFTGAHADYHRPGDSADKINAAGAAAVSRLAERVVLALQPARRLTYRKGLDGAGPLRGDARSFRASLGTMPDYAGPPGGQAGVLLAGVRAGAGADKAGMRRGDILVRLGAHAVRNVEDLMYALNASKPGDTVTAVVVRDGREVELRATFEEARRNP